MQADCSKRIRKPAVFLDRDGVLTEECGYVTSVDRLCVFPFAEMCVRQIHEKGYYAIVITNQSGVARGLFSEEELLRMNACLMQRTGVDAVFYCPHHPEGTVEKYRKSCRCRKPGIGMFQEACRKFDIDLTNSYMVGDRAGDVIAGRNAKVKTILVQSGYGTDRLEERIVPDFVCQDLRDVVEML